MADLIDPKILNQLLDYNPETGELHWKLRTATTMVCSKGTPTAAAAHNWNQRFAGKLAFTANTGDGYLNGHILYQRHLAHRVIWAMVTGKWPADGIDHIDGDTRNNRWINLREATDAVNGRNKRMPSTNTTGVVGVYWSKQAKKWEAKIQHDRKTMHLGLFEAFDDAVKARKEAEARAGFHPNHGRSQGHAARYMPAGTYPCASSLFM